MLAEFRHAAPIYQETVGFYGKTGYCPTHGQDGGTADVVTLDFSRRGRAQGPGKYATANLERRGLALPGRQRLAVEYSID
jgi:hypothetical protein